MEFMCSCVWSSEDKVRCRLREVFHLWFETGVFIGLELLQVGRLGVLEASRAPLSSTSHLTTTRTTRTCHWPLLFTWVLWILTQTLTCGAKDSPTEMSPSPSWEYYPSLRGSLRGITNAPPKQIISSTTWKCLVQKLLWHKMEIACP